MSDKLAIELQEKITKFVNTPVENLITNIHRKDDGVVIVSEIEQDMLEFQSMLKKVNQDILDSLPLFYFQKLRQKLEGFFTMVSELQNFQKSPDFTDERAKQKFTNYFKHPYNLGREREAGFFHYHNRVVWEVIVQGITLTTAKKLNNDKIGEIRTELLGYETVAQSSIKNLKNIISSAQDELASAGVEKHSLIFNTEAETHKASADSWKQWSIILIALVVVVVLTFFAIFVWCLDDVTSPRRLIETGVLAALIISMLSYAISLTVKNFFAEKHLESVNRHKANCLSTFNTFVDSADEERKAAVLLQATQTIFSHQKSGFLSKENEASNPNPVVEVVRNVSKNGMQN